MESLVHVLQKKFFREVQFPTQEEPPHAFDLIIDPKRYEEAPHHTYNAALYQRLETLEYLDRVAFLEYQSSLYENPLQWLESLTGLIRSLSFNEWFSLSDSVDQYLHIIRQLHERYKAEITLALPYDAEHLRSIQQGKAWARSNESRRNALPNL